MEPVTIFMLCKIVVRKISVLKSIKALQLEMVFVSCAFATYVILCVCLSNSMEATYGFAKVLAWHTGANNALGTHRWFRWYCTSACCALLYMHTSLQLGKIWEVFSPTLLMSAAFAKSNGLTCNRERLAHHFSDAITAESGYHTGDFSET